MFESFFGTTVPAYFASVSPLWPRTLNHPPSTFLPISRITDLLQAHPDPESYAGFQACIQTHTSKGVDIIEVVPRQMLEKTKELLLKASDLLSETESNLPAKLLYRSSTFNIIGAALITLGAVGTYFTQVAQAEKNADTQKSKFVKYMPCISIIAGLALVVLSSYQVRSAADCLTGVQEAFEALTTVIE